MSGIFFVMGLGGCDLFRAGCGWLCMCVTSCWLGVSECDHF